MDFKIIGIVGPIACGKGVVVEYLKRKYGYSSFSLSSILHDELKKKGIATFTRITLQDLGDELRKKEGDGALAKIAVKKLQIINSKSQKVIIEGIRNPGEIEYLRTIPGFYLIAIDAKQKIRFQRVLDRAKPWDPKDWESFLTIDGRDRGDKKNTNGQQVKKCMEMANVKIENNATVSEIQEHIEKLKL